MKRIALVAGAATLAAFAPEAFAADAAASGEWPWWAWPLALFLACFVLGIIAVPAGVGGGVLFVPIVSGFFPFHIDFVRGAGLLVALAGALAAGPKLLEGGLANLRVGLPMALVASTCSIGGAMLGLAMPTNVVQVALGAAILGIVAVMASVKNSDFPHVPRPDALSQALGMHGIFRDASTGRDVEWRTHRTIPGFALFAVIGVLAGMFGLGAGWANLPVLNLVMGLPLKVSAGTSGFVLSLVDSSAAWIYVNHGAVLPMVAAPSVLGMMLGARLGAKVLNVVKGSTVRKLVLALLLFAGLRALAKGFGVWN